MNFWRLFRFIPIFLLAVYLSADVASGQSIDDFSISSEPEYPKAGQQVTISIESYYADLSRSNTTWKEGGVVIAKEIGLTSRTFFAPGNGASKEISVEVTTPNGFLIKKEYVLAPQALDILWEAVDSYVPPFYKGKAMPGEQSLVKVTAIPNFTNKGAILDRSQTVYTWTIGGRRSEGGSGYNKSSAVFSFNPIKNSETVKVIASTLSGSSQTEEIITLRPYKTDILFYEASPLLGTLYERAFTRGLRLITNEITLVAVPYYFSGAKNIDSNLGFTWTVDKAPVNVGIDSTRLTLKSPGRSGRADIGVAVAHIEKTLQNVKAVLPIVYEK